MNCGRLSAQLLLAPRAELPGICQIKGLFRQTVLSAQPGNKKLFAPLANPRRSRSRLGSSHELAS